MLRFWLLFIGSKFLGFEIRFFNVKLNFKNLIVPLKISPYFELFDY